ncbi:MAG: hypothetical protein ACFFCQ_07195 [Promethearchaeota archaeon]
MSQATSWIKSYAKLLNEGLDLCHTEKDWDIFIEHFLLHSPDFAVFHSLLYLKLIEREFGLLDAMHQEKGREFAQKETRDQFNKLSQTFKDLEEGLLTFLTFHQRLEGKALTNFQIKRYLDRLLEIADSVLKPF